MAAGNNGIHKIVCRTWRVSRQCYTFIRPIHDLEGFEGILQDLLSVSVISHHRYIQINQAKSTVCSLFSISLVEQWEYLRQEPCWALLESLKARLHQVPLLSTGSSRYFFFLLIQERTKQVSIMYQNHNSLKEYCRSRGVATMKTSKRKLPVG